MMAGDLPAPVVTRGVAEHADGVVAGASCLREFTTLPGTLVVRLTLEASHFDVVKKIIEADDAGHLPVTLARHRRAQQVVKCGPLSVVEIA